MAAPDDGFALLTGPGIEPVLHQAVQHAGGELLQWRLDHVDNLPGDSTTATYRGRVRWPLAERDEVLGVSMRAAGLDARDEAALAMATPAGTAACWIHPHDPDLPGLARAAHPDQAAALAVELGLAPAGATAADVELAMVSYRPRRRAVLRLTAAGRTSYVKALRADLFAQVLARHELLRGGLVPTAPVLATTDDHLLVLDELPGTPLATAMFTEPTPCTAEQLVDLLDDLPPGIARLERRAPWTDGLRHYAEVVAATLPDEQRRLDWLCSQVEQGLAGTDLGDEPTHGDFHEAQLHVAGGRVVGLLDVDTLGPGRRADDLACLVAHLSCVQRMDQRQAQQVHGLLRSWMPVFDERVDAAELRLRAAGVAVSLATGPHRGQEPDWQLWTRHILDAAEALVRQAG